ncbi:hypothetical protein [Rhizobium leguminosarum]|uniref:hypothetical protein n=1 Tax=Rhizobium TaxID=379 RepID=UPI003D7B471B
MLLNAIGEKATSQAMHGIYQKYGIPAERIANVVAIVIDQPEDTTMNEFTVGPANQPW